MAITTKLISKVASYGAKKWGSSAQRAALKKAVIASAKKRASKSSNKIKINKVTANTLNSKVSVGDLNNVKRKILNNPSKQPKTKISKVIQSNRKSNLKKVEKQINQSSGAYSTNAKLPQKLNAKSATNKLSKKPYNPVKENSWKVGNYLWAGIIGLSVADVGLKTAANYNIRKHNAEVRKRNDEIKKEYNARIL